MTNKEASSLIAEDQVQKQSCTDQLPPSDQITNMVSPNRRQLSSSPPPRISTSSSMLSDSDSPGSYTSYSSAEYSSLGGSGSGEGSTRPYLSEESHTDSTVGGNNSKKRALLKSIHTNNNSSSRNNKNEFSHGLLSQVHKMQSLLEEYQHSLTALEYEKADNQQEINRLDKRLKAKGETEERYKEEIWNLELKNQDLQQKLDDLNQSYVKCKSESAQHVRLGATLSQEIEQLKAMKQSWEQKVQDANADHEKEILNLKKQLLTSKSEKEILTKQIQDLTAEHATVATTNLRHIDNEVSVTREKKNEKTAPLTSLSSSHSVNGMAIPETKVNKNSMSTITEVDTLKKSLDQAHEIIQTMQEKIDIERTERVEVDKLLREAQETIENFQSISHNNSAQWYPTIQSPVTRSAHNRNEHSHKDNDLLSPTSSHSMHSIHSDISSQYQPDCNSNLSRQPSRKSTVGKGRGKRLASVSKSPYQTRGGGRSLCDELSQAGSVGNFASSTTGFSNSPIEIKVSVDDKEHETNMKIQNESSSLLENTLKESNLSPKSVPNIQQGINEICKEDGNVGVDAAKTEDKSKQEQGINEPNGSTLVCKSEDQCGSVDQSLITDLPISATELSQIDLPSISNHEMYSSFSSKSSSGRSTAAEEEDNYSEEIKIVVQQQNAHYGSLLKKPESYIYKSRRELDKEISNQNKAVTKAMLDNAITEKLPKLRTGLDSQELEGRKREDVDDKSVTALTRTMIGDWMWKYTRKVVGSGISENRHRRFFWIHPYTQTLYWSSKEPGSDNRQSNTKSVLVESFVVLDDDSQPEKSIPPSILIKTPSRGLKIQCMNIVAHQAWLKSLNFLLDGSQISNEIKPKLSSLGNVSKQHYIRRQKTVQKQQPVNNTSSTVTTATKDNGSSITDISHLPFKFEPLATVAIDDLMPLPSPTVFTL